MKEIILVSLAVLIILLIISYTILRMSPSHKKPMIFLPSIIAFVGSILLLIISFVIGRFEGMGLGVLSIGTTIASVLAFMGAALMDNFPKNHE